MASPFGTNQTQNTLYNNHPDRVQEPNWAPNILPPGFPAEKGELEGLPISEPSQKCSDNILPDGFEMKEDGLFFKGKWVCSQLQIKAFVRDINSKYWGRLTEFQDPDGKTHTEIITGAELTPKNFHDSLQRFLESGLRINPTLNLAKILPDYLINTQVNRRLISILKTGWYERRFVLGNNIIPGSSDFYVQIPGINLDCFGVKGTFQEWVEHIAVPCGDNSRLMFTLCAAFAAVLLPLIGHETIGFNFLGSSSIGKSTALSVAASVYGSPKYVQQWKLTSNGLEALAAMFNHCLLCLDEMGQANPATIGNDIYTLSNGSGKVRMTKEILLREIKTWLLLYLSSGELSVEQKSAEAGKKAQAGMMIRNMDIPADAGKGFGIFETLHDFSNGHEFSCFLKNNTAQYYGTAIREFLTRLIDVYPDFSTLKPMFKIVEKHFIADYVPKDADGQVKRAAMHFSVIAWAGELAIQHGILPYEEGQAYFAVKDCFQAWLENRGTSHSYEEEEIIDRVKAFIEAHHSTRFATSGLDQGLMTEKIHNQAGYKRKNDQGSYEFYVFTNVFKNEICKDFNVKKANVILAQRGMLRRDSQGRYTISLHIKDFGRSTRMVCLTPQTGKEIE